MNMDFFDRVRPREAVAHGARRVCVRTNKGTKGRSADSETRRESLRSQVYEGSEDATRCVFAGLFSFASQLSLPQTRGIRWVTVAIPYRDASRPLKLARPALLAHWFRFQTSTLWSRRLSAVRWCQNFGMTKDNHPSPPKLALAQSPYPLQQQVLSIVAI